MKLIAGLGNPGNKYENNRHNLGYMVVDRVLKVKGLNYKKNPDLMCDIARDREVIYIKPTTYMNDSGNSIKAVCNYFKINNKDILVIQDDLDLSFGKIRLSFNGTSAGHHGIDSAIENLGTMDFGRLRIGIGKPEKGDGTKYVLENFLPEEKVMLEKVIDLSVQAVDSYLSDGVMATMNRFN